MSARPEVIGPQVNLPGSQQLAPVAFGLLTLLLLAAVGLSWFIRRRRSAPGSRPFPVVTAGVGALAAASLVMTVVWLPPPFEAPEFPPLPRLLPDEAVFYVDARELPVAEGSRRWLDAMDDTRLLAAFGDQAVDGVVFGIPFNTVDEATPRTSIRYRRNAARFYGGELPVPSPAYVESLPTYGIDNHYVALDVEAREMWELIGTTVWFGRWEADTGAFWDLDSLDYGDGFAMASHLPLLPGVVTFEEVAAGRVDHVVHAASGAMSSTEVVWPARDTDGPNDDPDAPPMGAWLRLRPDADLDGLGPQARVIAEGLQRHGLILSDTSGGNFAIRGTPDRRFDRQDLRGLERFGPADFEVVDQSGIMVSEDSIAARRP